MNFSELMLEICKVNRTVKEDNSFAILRNWDDGSMVKWLNRQNPDWV